MSARWRQKRANERKNIASVEADDVVGQHEAVDPTPQYIYDDPFGVTIPFDSSVHPAMPGQREFFHAEFENNTRFPSPTLGILGNKDLIDYEIGGQSGVVNDLPYSMGVVSSDLVEDFNMKGEQAYIRRLRSPQDDGGPVGAETYNGQLALVYEQLSNQYFPNERSQRDLIRGV